MAKKKYKPAPELYTLERIESMLVDGKLVLHLNRRGTHFWNPVKNKMFVTGSNTTVTYIKYSDGSWYILLE